jgi:hypothetical protein
MTFQERTTPFLKPLEVANKTRELNRLQGIINAPDYQRRQVQDMGTIVKRRNGLRVDLEKNEPRAYETAQLDAATKREAQLLRDITEGMPTQAEMRRSPPGSVDKHLGWEAVNKAKIMEWKNIRRRLQVSGDAETREAVDASNLEKYRPAGGVSELSMDNAAIPGKSIHLPPNIEIKNVMSDADRLAAKLETLNAMAEQGNERAKQVLALFDALPETQVAPAPPPPAPAAPAKKGPSEKQLAARKAAGERLRKMHAERRRKAAEAKNST